MTSCFSLVPGFRKRSLLKEQRTESHLHPSTCCSFEPLPEYSAHQKGRLSDVHIGEEKLNGIMAEVAITIECKIKSLDAELRDLSLKMWDLKEIKWEER
jgi:hypothetical protein